MVAVVDIPDDLLRRVLPQLKHRQGLLAHRIHSSKAKGRTEGTIDADQRRLRDLEQLTAILEAAHGGTNGTHTDTHRG